MMQLATETSLMSKPSASVAPAEAALSALPPLPQA
jgi:hypothetical protein